MKKTHLIAGALLLGTFALGAMAADSHPQPKEKTFMTMPKTVNELIKIDQAVGEGAEAKALNNVTVHYTGWLYDPSKPEGHGAKFDSSLDRGDPFTFYLGGGRGAGGVIPPYATLVFDVELLDVR